MSMGPQPNSTTGSTQNGSRLGNKAYQETNLNHHASYMSSEEDDTLRDEQIQAGQKDEVVIPSDSERERDVERDAEKEAVAVPSAAGKDAGEEEDPNVVYFAPGDPENPYNWPMWKTLLNCFWVSFMTFISPLASSIFAPAVPDIQDEFNNHNNLIAAFVVSVYLLGYAFGPLIMAPMSELYGRVPIYHISNIGFVAFCVGCALAPNMSALIVFRFLAGVFGSTPMTNGGGSIADMVPMEKRAAAMSTYIMGPLMGPVIGPIAGAFLADAKGWRWCFWLLVIVSGFITVAMFFTTHETYAPIILKRRVARLKKETGNDQLRSKLDTGRSPSVLFQISIVRPLKLLFLSPILIITSLYVAISYGYMYIMFTSLTEVFEGQYHFASQLVGLTYIGLGVGCLLGVVVYSSTSDRYLKRKSAAADALAEAEGRKREGLKSEYRLFLLPVGAILLPIGLFFYGWTADKNVHWIAPIIATAFVGCANMIFLMSVMMYLVDAFNIYAASALAASTVMRSIAGALLPLAGLPLYKSLGLGWGNSLLGFIALALAPGSLLIIKYGELLRKRFEIKNL